MSTFPAFDSVKQQSSCISTRRSDRGFSRKVQEMVKQLERETKRAETGRDGETGGKSREKHEPKNWKQLSERELSRMGTVARSRYEAYEPVPKDMQERQQESLRRVRERRANQKMTQQNALTLTQLVELERDSELIGLLKAAEARHRVKLLRERYEQEQNLELQHLINSQPSSIAAVRFTAFMKPHPPTPPHHTSALTRTQRKRCEILIEDDKGLTTNRIP